MKHISNYQNKASKKTLLLIINCIFYYNFLFSQTIVNFDCNTGKLSKRLPFDEVFTIHLNNLKRECKYVTINIKEIVNSKKIFTKLKSKDIITEEDYIKYNDTSCNCPLYTSTKNRPTIGDSISFGIPFQLKPNRPYFLNIIFSDSIPLSNEEITSLTKFISQNKNIKKTINEVINDAVFSNSYRGITPLIITIKQEVKNWNPNAYINTTNIENDLITIADEIINIIKTKNTIRKISEHILYLKEESIKDSKSFPLEKISIYDEKIKSITDNIVQQDWMLLDINTPIIKQINELYEKVKVDNYYKAFLENIGTEINDIEGLNKFISNRALLISTPITNAVIKRTSLIGTIGTTYSADFTENANFYITYDAGLSYAYNFDAFLFYQGINIYFRPINKNIPLSNFYRGSGFFGTRTSLLLGHTFNGVNVEDKRKGIIDNKALVIGAGFRLTPFLKVNGGSMFYYSLSTNPLISRDNQKTAFAPFISLSLDIDIISTLSAVGKSIFKIQ